LKAVLAQELIYNARTERRPECGGRAAAKRAVRM
jgi:hypothetical protein